MAAIYSVDHQIKHLIWPTCYLPSKGEALAKARAVSRQEGVSFVVVVREHVLHDLPGGRALLCAGLNGKWEASSCVIAAFKNGRAIKGWAEEEDPK
jgi:hypothetical protein